MRVVRKEGGVDVGGGVGGINASSCIPRKVIT